MHTIRGVLNCLEPRFLRIIYQIIFLLAGMGKNGSKHLAQLLQNIICTGLPSVTKFASRLHLMKSCLGIEICLVFLISGWITNFHYVQYYTSFYQHLVQEPLFSFWYLWLHFKQKWLIIMYTLATFSVTSIFFAIADAYKNLSWFNFI